MHLLRNLKIVLLIEMDVTGKNKFKIIQLYLGTKLDIKMTIIYKTIHFLYLTKAYRIHLPILPLKTQEQLKILVILFTKNNLIK
jgi:hypothetical protein